eukprot:1175637-Prorocentrum_minimum.AAC.3
MPSGAPRLALWCAWGRMSGSSRVCSSLHGHHVFHAAAAPAAAAAHLLGLGDLGDDGLRGEHHARHRDRVLEPGARHLPATPLGSAAELRAK